MKTLKEPAFKLFWDTSVWMPLFGFWNDDNQETERRRQADLQTYLPNIEMGSAGVIFSPCILADIPKNLVIAQLQAKLAPFEEAGYMTVLEGTSDWEGIAALREMMRRDIKENPRAFEQVNRRNLGLGDVAVVYASIKTGCDELWTYDALLCAFSLRKSVRGIAIVEPHPLQLQGILDFTEPPIS